MRVFCFRVSADADAAEWGELENRDIVRHTIITGAFFCLECYFRIPIRPPTPTSDDFPSAFWWEK